MGIALRKSEHRIASSIWGDVVALLLFAGCCAIATSAQAQEQTLAEARHGFSTKLVIKETAGFAVDAPPAGVLDLVKYKSPIGELPAYISHVPTEGKKHPAIIWLVGGFSNSISSVVWDPSPATNDQSASVFRGKGIVTMYPSLRGGNENPGFMENFYGEVDDVIAAADFLSHQRSVDPSRIYLGGHSTGGTLALLISEVSPRFRAVFAFGPVSSVLRYGRKNLFFSFNNPKEVDLRAPGNWFAGIRSRTFVFEGTEKPSNVSELNKMAESNQNPLVIFQRIPGATHFTGLRPVSGLIAEKILKDAGQTTSISFDPAELKKAVGGQ